MENELEHLNWSVQHALAQFEGPLGQQLNSCFEVSPTSSSSPTSPQYQKLLDTIHGLDKLLRNITPPHLTLVDAVFGFTTSKIILCSTQYKFADHVATLEPCSITDLAKAAGLHEQGVAQIIRYLREQGYFTQDSEGKISNNRLSNFLRTNNPWYNWANYFPDEYYSLLSHLPEQLKLDQSKTATELYYNTDKPLYQFLAETQRAAAFHKITGSGTQIDAPGLLADYPWNEVLRETVVDIGAGAGDFLCLYLKGFSNSKAAAFELPSTAAILRDRIQAQDPIADRLEVFEGDFWKDDLPQSSVYVLRWVLHNWDDEQCVTLLKRIRKRITLKPGISRVLVMESVVSDGLLGRGARYGDIRMLVRCRSQERTLEAYHRLAELAGWKVERVVFLREAITQVLDFRPVDV